MALTIRLSVEDEILLTELKDLLEKKESSKALIEAARIVVHDYQSLKKDLKNTEDLLADVLKARDSLAYHIRSAKESENQIDLAIKNLQSF